MSAVRPRRAAPAGWASSRPSVLILRAGLLTMAVPLVWDWSHGTWDMQTQGHEPLILAISAWLVYRQREALAALQCAGGAACRRRAVRAGTAGCTSSGGCSASSGSSWCR